MPLPLSSTGSDWGDAAAARNVPSGTALGDMLLYAANPGSSVDDARFTQVAERVWVCEALPTLASYLTPHTSFSIYQQVSWNSPAPARLGEATEVSGSGPVISIPAARSLAALCVITYTCLTTDPFGFIDTPEGYLVGSWGPARTGSGAPGARREVRIALRQAVSTPAPASTVTINGSTEADWQVAVIPFINRRRAPACRKTGRGDHQGIGSGRIFPPPITQQSGRLTGPY
ncbi:MAG TPA: hypothetical protein VJL80_09785 [Aeromicrobium sp.]|nr:hypothetical protein [Aeromicrobium sp.]HKY58316.1 hypothetical protein [Aeromicrobium sp.]